MLASDPNAHKGASVNFVGQVFTTPERDEKGVYVQVWEDPASSENNTIVAYADPHFQLAEDDYVHVVGTVKGEFKGKNALGVEVSAVTVLADTFKVVDARPSGSARCVHARASTADAGRDHCRDPEGRIRNNRDASVHEGNECLGSRCECLRLVYAGRAVRDAARPRLLHRLPTSIERPPFRRRYVRRGRLPEDEPYGGLKLNVEVNSDNSEVGDYGTLTYTFIWPKPARVGE
jgi:hypothetical protein